MRGIKEKPGKETIRLHSEKQACPRRGNPEARDAQSSSARQTEEGGEGFWNTEQCDADLRSSWGTRIASEPLVPRETIMRPLSPGQGGRRDVWAGRGGRLHLHHQALAAQQLHARSAMEPPAPVLPEERSRPDGEGMQQHAHLTRLFGGAALPLTLPPQRTGTATADAGRIDHAQASIGFSALLMGYKRLTSRTAQRAIWLEGKVLTREAVLFPGQSHSCRPIL